MEEITPPTKINLLHSDSKIIFLIRDCSLNKDYSFWKLNREQAELFIARLKHIEEMTWAQFSNIPRGFGLTVEKPGTKSYDMIDLQNTSPEKLMGEKYYFHFRIKQSDLFRVFGYQKRQYFCITHLDRDGSVHH